MNPASLAARDPGRGASSAPPRIRGATLALAPCGSVKCQRRARLTTERQRGRAAQLRGAKVRGYLRSLRGLLLLGDDQLADLGVGRPGNDLAGHQVGLALVGPALDYLLRIG